MGDPGFMCYKVAWWLVFGAKWERNEKCDYSHTDLYYQELCTTKCDDLGGGRRMGNPGDSDQNKLYTFMTLTWPYYIILTLVILTLNFVTKVGMNARNVEDSDIQPWPIVGILTLSFVYVRISSVCQFSPPWGFTLICALKQAKHDTVLRKSSWSSLTVNTD